jgi:two-component system nitrogen regulation sensor histidine kinase NtrY
VRASRSAEDGLVLTFDDITRLVTAQRNAAWRDVARRIAHEIKNPLTPIQLSAERLRRKYRKDITEATWRPSTAAPTPSSARWATSAGWSTSSRPSPACRRRSSPADAAELLRQAVFAQRVASPRIEVELVEPSPSVTRQLPTPGWSARP